MGRAGQGSRSSSSRSSSSSHRSSSSRSSGHRISSSRAGQGSRSSSSSRSYGSSIGYGGYNSYGSNRRSNYGSSVRYGTPSSGGFTFLGKFISIFIIIAICVVIYLYYNPIKTVKSTITREKLTDVDPYTTDCVRDDLNWINSENSTGKSLKAFYDKTGIQPYIYLKAYDSNLVTDEQKDTFASNYFDSMGYKDNAMLFIYFCEKNESDVGYMCMQYGNAAATILDMEAIDIFWSYIDNYWYSDLDTDEMFETVYNKTANGIMSTSKTSKDIVFVLIITLSSIIMLAIVYAIIMARIKAGKAKMEHERKILNTDVNDMIKSNTSKYYEE